EALFNDQGLQLGGVSKQNHPAIADQLTAAFDEAVQNASTDWSVQVSFRTPDMHAAAVGWLRAAYLIAFAALGYGYILRRELDPVGEQTRRPTELILDRFCVITPDGSGGNQVYLVREPAELESVLVFFEQDCAVLLPSTESTGTYERLENVEPWPPGT